MKRDRHGFNRRQGTIYDVLEARRDFAVGRSERAESILEALLADHPGETEAWLALAVIAEGTGRRDAAMQRIRSALEVDPNYSPALSSMSALLLHEGRVEEAVEYAKRAVSTDPGNSECRAALARCLVKSNRRPEAVAEFQRAVGLSPGNPRPMVELSDVLIDLRREREALELLRNAAPRSADVRPLVNLAYLELRFGRIEDAERYVRTALTRKPDLAPAETLLARILTEKLDLDAAEPHWQRAEKLSNAAGSILVEKALALSAVGRFEDAIRNLRRSIELEPRQGAAYQAFAYAKKIDQADRPLVELMEEVAADPGLADPDRLSILFALGKAYDNLGEYGRAIEFFDRAHDVCEKRFLVRSRFDRDGFRAFARCQNRSILEGAIRRTPGPGHGRIYVPLILVVGAPLLGDDADGQQYSSCHPEVGGAGEQDFWGGEEAANPRQASTPAAEYVDLLDSRSIPGFPPGGRLAPTDPPSPWRRSWPSPTPTSFTPAATSLTLPSPSGRLQ